MKILFLTGSHPRHIYIGKRLYEEGLLHGVLVENRENLIPRPPSNLSEVDKKNFVRHFKDRQESENRFFGNLTGDFFENRIERFDINKEELNGLSVKKWIGNIKPDIVISYGIHKLSEEMLNILPRNSFNIHGGLSPWYRGNITLFWPFYFLKPNFAGMTIHELTDKIDGGDILHHSVPKLVRGDGIHDVACKAVLQVSEDLIIILKMMKEGKEIPREKQKSFGKIFNSKDWTPQHLRLIYNTFDNDIVDKFLDGELGFEQPNLVKAF